MSNSYEPPEPPEYDPYDGLTGLTGTEPLPPLEDPMLPPATPPRSPLLTGLILGLLLVVLSIAVFNLTRDDETGGETATPETTEAPTETSGTDATTPTTEASNGTEVETTTTTAPPNFDPYPAIGEAIALDDLTLKTAGLGDIALGTNAADAIGALTATFGDPTADTGPITATGAFGACEGGTIRVVTFGALAAVVIIDDDGTEVFAGYRLDLTYEDAATSAAVDLETLSGLKLGNNVTDLRNIYSAFDVAVITDTEYGRIFELRGSSGNLLLWGPVLDSGDEGTDTIMGIYSADADGNFC